MKKKIFVTLSTFAQYGDDPLRILERSGFDYEVNTLGRRLRKEEISQLAQGCHGVVAGVEPYDEEVLAAMPDLQCISRCGVGVDNIDHKIAEEKGIVIRNTPDVVIQPVAELTIAMIFDVLRKLTVHTILLRSKKWEKKAGNLLKGKKVGILGLGRIGKRVVEMLIGLGAKVCGTDIFPDEEWVNELGVTIVSVEELLAKSDILSIHLACTEDNAFVLGAKEIALMKQGAFIINTSRGDFIDEAALQDALIKNQLAGAALDVFSEEPYDGPLGELDNVVLTPHIATLTKESRLQMEVEAVQNALETLNDFN